MKSFLKHIRYIVTTGLVLFCTFGVSAAELFVSPNGNNSDGTSWANAFTSIQAAVDVSRPGDTVTVTNGTYGPITNSYNRAITIQSVNGADVTLIDGAGDRRCATLGDGQYQMDTILCGFTLTNGVPSGPDLRYDGVVFGGGVQGGTLNDCILVNNKAALGGGAYDSILNNCVLVSNSADAIDDIVSGAGGAFFCTLYDCILTNNFARTGGGGVSYCLLDNCILVDNYTAGGCGGGASFSTLYNSFLIGNTGPSFGGGAYAGALYNCTLVANSAAYGGGAWGQSPSARCTLNNCTLVGNSSTYDGGGTFDCTLTNCIVWRNTSGGSGADIAKGSSFYTCSSNNGTSNGCIQADPKFVDEANGDYRLQANSPCVGMGDPATVEPMLDVGGKSIYTGGRVNIGAYSTMDGTFYVSPNGDDANNGSCWRFAKKTIQAAIDAVAAGSTIVVSNGIYAPIATANKAITIQSANGAHVAIINGGGTNCCATLGDGLLNETSTVLCGFTLTNGYASSFSSGGGACGGTLNDCILIGNSSLNGGGGAHFSTLNNCTLSNNSGSFGGGAWSCGLNACVLTGNSAGSGGGVYGGTLNNCLLTGNSAISGGGASGGSLTNCTLVGNTATFDDGAGVIRASLFNCIVWGNTKEGVTNDIYDCELAYTCSSDGGTDNGCIQADPKFVDAADGDYRLCTDSPCAGIGDPSFREVERPMLDVYGNSIYTDGRINMGAYGTANIFYVSPDGNDANNGACWALAKKTIQAAIDVAAPDSTIMVTNGIYASLMTGRKVLTIKSVNGASVTFIDGDGTNRCATLSSSGLLRYATLSGFTITNGVGGVFGGTVSNCVIIGNSTDGFGGGAQNCAVYSCVIIANSARFGGAVAHSQLYNCTLVGNSAGCGGGAALAGLKNCIVWGNTATIEGNDVYQASMTYTCSSDGGTDNGCIQTDPLFLDAANGNYRLKSDSPCAGTGDPTFLEGELSLLDVHAKTIYTDGRINMGSFSSVDKRYVNGLQTDDSGDGLTWTTAKKSIQAAIDAADVGATVMVTNGTYTSIIAINKEISIRSVNGAAVTIIDGGGTNCCATLYEFYLSHSSCIPVLCGFTLTNGVNYIGGGAHGGTLNDCVLIGNEALSYGGGAAYCTLNNCILLNNRVYSKSSGYGGGADSCILNNCVLSGNWASYNGGGASESMLNNCLLVNNSVNMGSGGGAYKCILDNSTIFGNSAATGGGVFESTLSNCIVWGNQASRSNDIYNCASLVATCSSDGGTNDGCIQEDPQFLDAANGDYRLLAGSPCLGTAADGGDMGAFPGGYNVVEISGENITPTGVVPIGVSTSLVFTASETNSQGRAFSHFMTNGVLADATMSFEFTPGGVSNTLEAVYLTYAFLDAQGGMVETNRVDAPYGALYPELPEPELTGYTFTGWNLDAAGEGSMVTGGVTLVTNRLDHTLYAQWSTNAYVVTLEPIGGTLPGTNQLNVLFDSVYPELPEPVLNGYSFEGWAFDVAGLDGVATGGVALVTNACNHTLYAQWSTNVYVLTLAPAGGTLDGTNQFNVSFDSAYPEFSKVSRVGHAFDGWTLPSGEVVTGGVTVVSTSDDHTLTATWHSLTAVMLELDGGTHKGSAQQSMYEGDLAEIIANIPKVGYGFQRWIGMPDEELGDAFNPYAARTTLKMPGTNVSLTAVFVKNPGTVEVTFDPDQVGAASLVGLEWSVDGKVWFPADIAIRVPSGTRTLYVRSIDGRWLVPKTTRVNIVASTTDELPQGFTMPVQFAPAFDEESLAYATDPNSDQGQWSKESGQLDWTGLRVGLRAKLGLLPLQANATFVKLKSGKLPTGLKLVTIDGQVYLSGIPTKAGTYPAVLQALEGKKAGALLPVVWTVQDLPTEYIGTFNGVYTATTNGITRHSALKLTVGKTGKLTGSVSLGGKKYSLKADAFDAIDYATEAMSVTNAAFICTSPKLTNSVSLTISLSGAGLGVFNVTNLPSVMDDYTGQAVRNGWKDKTFTPQRELRTNTLTWAKGYYTLSLYTEDNDRDIYGAGYITLTVDTMGGVKAAGKLADGTTVSGSGVLLVTDTEVSTVIALSPSAYKGGEFYLNVKFIQDAQPRIDAAEPVNWVNTVTTTTSNGPFERKPSVKGGWYSQLTSLYSVYDTSYDPENPYKLGLNADAITTAVSMQFNAKGTGVDALAKTNNPYNVKLTLTSKTGLFSGSFNETGVKTAYKLYGILTPYLVSDTDDTAGLGFYSIPVAVPKTQRSELFRLTTQAVEP